MLELNGTIIAVIANFLILAWVLNWFFYKPVEEVIEARKRSAAAVIEDAEKRLSEAESLKYEYEDKLKEMEERSREMLKSAASSAKAMQQEIIEEARKEAGFVISAASEEARALKREVYVSVKASIGALVCDAAGRLIRKNIDRDSNKALIDEIVSELERSGLN